RRGPLGVQSDITIRGGSFDQVLILINGVRMNDAQTGHHTLYLPIEMLDIERIEIIKGPAARSYGQNAFSGAVNIITKSPKNTGLQLHSSLGSFNTWQVGMNTSLNLLNDNLSQSLAINYAKSDGYDYNRDFNSGSLFYQGKLNLPENATLQWFSGGSIRHFGANGFYALPTHIDQYEEVSTSISSLLFKKVYNKMSLTARVSHRWNDDYYEFVRNKPEIFNNKTTSNRFTLDINTSYYNALGILGVGVEYSDESLKSIGLGDHNRSIASGFIEQKINILSDQLQVVPGVFINKFSDRDIQIFPGIDASFLFKKKFKIFAGLNYANRIPTYTDLYYRSSVERGNPDLLSESMRSIEVGLEWKQRYSQIKLSAYRNQTSNLIDWTKNATTDQFWIARNYVATNFTGLEMSGSIDLKNLLNLPNTCLIDLSTNFIDAKTANSDNQYITRYQFNHLGNQTLANIRYGIINDNVFINVSYRYLDRASEDIDPSTGRNLLDAQLWDASVMYKWKKVELKYTANNITNQAYKEINNVLMPGRWHQLRLGMGI
ncbi:MAG TPA: TonB-dependent receptor, partial [Saprospiraceae bacterium]|nr:TonB-dependent receptor [Saprospiraceae bacterium]